jgi:dTDP-4-amino-4,6-dideoxygalactose transaminase
MDKLKDMTKRTFGEEELGLLKEVLASGKISSLYEGKMTPRFEREFARMIGAKYAIARNSAMSVLHTSVMASGCGDWR